MFKPLSAVLVTLGTILLFFLRHVPDPGENLSEKKVSVFAESWTYIKTSISMVKEPEVKLMMPIMAFRRISDDL